MSAGIRKITKTKLRSEKLLTDVGQNRDKTRAKIVPTSNQPDRKEKILARILTHLADAIDL